MPLVGIIDPSHNERAADEPGRKPAWLSVEDLEKTAYNADPKWSPWSYELIRAVLENHQERDYISTTLLTGGCARSKVLERREPYIASLDEYYAALRGTQIHRSLENVAADNALVEYRFSMDINGETLSCSPDIIRLNDDKTAYLGDYKTTMNPPNFYPYKSHTQQVNLNRYIVNHATSVTPTDPKRVAAAIAAEYTQLYLVYLGPKEPLTLVCEESQDYTFPNGRKGKRRMPYVQTDAQVEKWFLPKLEAMQQALASYPKWPWKGEAPGFEGKPGWECPGRPYCNIPGCLAKRYPSGLTWS